MEGDAQRPDAGELYTVEQAAKVLSRTPGRVRRLLRSEALERAGGGDCPKHAGVLATFVNGHLRTATRRGEPMGAAERAEFEAAGWECPECGAGFLNIRVPSKTPRP